MKKILLVIDGCFGRRVLKPTYRKIWRTITYGALLLIFLNYILFPIFHWWDKLVNMMNYIIWG